MVTRGERRLGRTIRKLGNSVELSTKESNAKESEKKYRKSENSQDTRTTRPFKAYAILSSTRKTPQNLELLQAKAFQEKLAHCNSISKEKKDRETAQCDRLCCDSSCLMRSAH